MTEQWIPITFLSESTQEKLSAAINACHVIHIWTMGMAQEIRYNEDRLAVNRELDEKLTEYIHQESLLSEAQRYSLTKAMENAKREIRRDLPTPISISETFEDEITIQARKIWWDYILRYEAISTTYGLLMLEGSWRWILQSQAEEAKVDLHDLHELWQSATVKKKEEEGYSLRFNLRKG